MTNKFSHTNKTMKPPAICIKPPPRPRYIPPPLTDQSVQGYAEYFDAASPAEGGMTSTIELFPNGPVDEWFGSAVAGDFKIHLLMNAYADRSLLSFEFDWFIENVLRRHIEIDDHIPRSWAPFDTGVVTPMPQPSAGRNHWRFWF